MIFITGAGCKTTRASHFRFSKQTRVLLTLGAHAHESYCSYFVCLCVCVCVCHHSNASIQCVCNKLNLLMGSLLDSKGFQLTDFAKTLSFSS